MDVFILLKEKKAVGALAGFATGLYVASALFTMFYSENAFATPIDGAIIVFIFSVVVTFFSFCGVHYISDNHHLKENRSN